MAVNQAQTPLFITVPHAGEEVPKQAVWLNQYQEAFLLTDVDRFVDQLYLPAMQKFQIPSVVAKVHRYAVDLNRYPDDIDADSVIGAKEPSGKHVHGFHWVKSTQGQVIMHEPIERKLHNELVAKFHDSFHDQVAEVVRALRAQFAGRPVYHLDCHSMPSEGTGAHEDSGEERAEVVVSDFHGKAAEATFKDSVIEAFTSEGFRVAYNWPYFGGRLTQRYGQPAQGHHTIQIELNRKLYMDERSREKRAEFGQMTERLARVIGQISSRIKPV